MRQRIERIRRAMEARRPLLAELDEAATRLEAKARLYREGLAKLNADFGALELRLAQLDDADEEMIGVFTEAVERAWGAIQADLDRLAPEGSRSAGAAANDRLATQETPDDDGEDDAPS